MVKKLAMLVGIVFVLIGVLGFVPALTPVGDDGVRRLLGLFAVNGVHTIVHLLSGVVALAAASTSYRAARMYFQVFGIVYAIVTVVGFIQGDSVLGIFPVNVADNILHLVLAVVFLYAGFGMRAEAETVREA